MPDPVGHDLRVYPAAGTAIGKPGLVRACARLARDEASTPEAHADPAWLVGLNPGRWPELPTAGPVCAGPAVGWEVVYRGGNWEPGTGWARLAVGGWLVKPITAQLMSTPSEP